MSKVFFASDLHLGHKNVTRFRESFSSAEEHHEIILDNLLSTVTKRDTLFLLGDVAFDTEWCARLLSGLKRVGKTVWVPGNHDVSVRVILGQAELMGLPDDKLQLPAFTSYKGWWLSHCPIHPDELRNRKGNIHGHTHFHNIPSKHYINVSMEQLPNWSPIEFKELVGERSN